MAISEQTPQETPGVKGTKEKLEELHRLKEAAMLGGGVKRIEAQHSKGKLTARERQVVCFAALGCSNKHIADELRVSESTVSEHLSAALTKLGAGSHVDLPQLLAGNRRPAKWKTNERPISHLWEFFATLYRKRQPFG